MFGALLCFSYIFGLNGSKHFKYLISFFWTGWELSFVGDNLLEDTMSYGVSATLLKFTTPKAPYLGFWVRAVLFFGSLYLYSVVVCIGFFVLCICVKWFHWLMWSLMDSCICHSSGKLTLLMTTILFVNRWFWRFICTKNSWDNRWNSCNLQKSRYVVIRR